MRWAIDADLEQPFASHVNDTEIRSASIDI
jgi:hypothetical protein